jgi:hypothetical protein
VDIATWRVQDPLSLSSDDIGARIARHGRVVVQFSGPHAHNPEVLEQLDGLCRAFGDRLEVRFSGHHERGFDASVLRRLPNVGNLRLDQLNAIRNEEALADLHSLSALQFGVYDFDRPDFLSSLRLDRLSTLALMTLKKPFDLSALARCQTLDTLFLDGPIRNLDAVAGLAALRRVTLRSCPKSVSLGFLNDIPNLRELVLVLGSRDTIDDLASASLNSLTVMQVRGLRSLGDLARLPVLRRLWIENQLQVTGLDLSGADLEYVWISNCTSLGRIDALERQGSLRVFQAGLMAMDMNALRDFPWPPGMQTVRLFSRSKKWTDETAAMFAAKGFGQEFVPLAEGDGGPPSAHPRLALTAPTP